MLIGIDATNISSGGGLTHLRELLLAADSAIGSDKVIIWSSHHTLKQLPERDWLIKKSDTFLNKGLLFRGIWKLVFFDRILRDSQCDVLFAPGGNYTGSFSPFVSMSQNMLPFEKKERDRFKPSLTHVRYLILNVLQTRSFRRAAGVVYLTQYAKDVITQQKGLADTASAIIPHGVNQQFYRAETATEPDVKVFSWLYVSIINFYKHQDVLVKAACELFEEGYDIKLNLVGPYNPKAYIQFQDQLSECDPESKVVNYLGAIEYSKLPAVYHEASAFVFPSSCENLPNILLEAMASELPIASSNCGPMPEVLQDAGVYFNPESVAEVAAAMKTIMDDKEYSSTLASNAKVLSRNYTWGRCADETLQFLRERGQKRDAYS